MACMCGDIMCPSCGPSQGYDPGEIAFKEWLQYTLFDTVPDIIDTYHLAEVVASRFYALTNDEWDQFLLLYGRE